MTAGVYVDVPEDLAILLEEDDFVVVGVAKGPGTDALIAINATGLGAGLTTILLARHDIHRFIGHLCAWTRNRSPGVEVTVVHAVGELSVTYQVKNLPPDVARDLITSSLAPLLGGDPEDGAR
jgi:hypothetical protein